MCPSHRNSEYIYPWEGDIHIFYIVEYTNIGYQLSYIFHIGHMTRVDVRWYYYTFRGVSIIKALQEFVLLWLRGNVHLTTNGNNYPCQQHHNGIENMHQHFQSSTQIRKQGYPVEYCIKFMFQFSWWSGQNGTFVQGQT